MAILSASILDADYSQLRFEVERVARAGVDAFTLDVMDGHFVPRVTFGDSLVAQIRNWIDLPIEVHMMMSDPAQWAPRFCDAGADLVMFHLEATSDAMGVVEQIRAERRAVGMAIMLETPIADIPDALLSAVDVVNIMAVPVGFGGNEANTDTIPRIQELRQRLDSLGLDTSIEVDGGVKVANAREFVLGGADVLTVGTGIYHAGDADEAVKAFREAMGVKRPTERSSLSVFLSQPSRSPIDDEGRRKRLDRVRESLDIPRRVWDPLTSPR